MYDKIKEELSQEFSELCDRYNEYYTKEKILTANTNEQNKIKRLIISTISYIPILFGSAGIFVKLGITSITMSMTIVLLLSLLVGYVGQKTISIFTRKSMKKFTNSKTDEEILFEANIYDMELAKIKNRREVIRKIYSSIDSKENILNEYQNEFTFTTNDDNLNEKELEMQKEALSKAYNKRCEQLDILSTQKFLINKFKGYRTKKKRRETAIEKGYYASLPFAILIGMPLGGELTHLTINSLLDLLKCLGLCFSPAIALFPVFTLLATKENKKYLKIYNRLNQSLGENSLPEIPNRQYEKEIQNAINTKIYETVELGIKIKEVSSMLEKIKSNQLIQKNLGRNSIENIITRENNFPDEVYRPNESSYEQMSSDISVAQPHLEEGKESDNKRVSDKTNPLIRKLVKKQNTGAKEE